MFQVLISQFGGELTSDACKNMGNPSSWTIYSAMEWALGWSCGEKNDQLNLSLFPLKNVETISGWEIDRKFWASGKNQNYRATTMYQKSSVMSVGSSWLRVPENHVRMANFDPRAGFLSQLGRVNLVCCSTLKQHHANKQPTDQRTKSNNKQPTNQPRTIN